MGTFEPRTFVNGAMLRQHSGQHVSIMVRVENEAGTNIFATTTDNQKIRAVIPEPLSIRKGSWVEIIGVPTGNDTIRAKEVIQFGTESGEFDEEGYNMMVAFVNHCKEVYRHG